MLCPKCNKSIARMIIKAGGEILTPCCDGITELSHFRGPLVSPKTKQRLEWQRESIPPDLEQPFELQKGKVAKGWQPNKKYIKTYKNDPAKMGMYNTQELKESGVVSKKEATAIKKHTHRNSQKPRP